MVNEKNFNLIDLNKLTNYLKLNNWKQDINFPNKNLLVFHKKYDDEEFDIVIPSQEKFKDFKLRLKDCINALSILEDKSDSIIVNEILKNYTSTKDILSIRLISKTSENGTLPLQTANNVIHGIKKLITSAISNENTPKPHIIGSNKDYISSIDNYNLAQTSVGSYIFNIEIKNDNKYQIYTTQDGDIVNIPKERRVISRIQTGINEIINAKYNNEKYNELLQNGYKKGLNANMCDALLEFRENDDTLEVETYITWGNNEFIPNNIPRSVTLKSKDFSILSSLSDIYKNIDPEKAELKGFIIGLFHEKTKREITLRAKYKRSNKNFKIEINEDDYKICCKAHAEEKQISIKGELLKIGKYTYLKNYSNLVILEIND